MKKFEFFTVRRDTGSNYNSFTGHYSSLESLLKCFKQNKDLVESYCHKARNELVTPNTKVLNKISDHVVDFEIGKSAPDGWGSTGFLLKIKVSNILISTGEYKVIPEVKVAGQPYQPEQKAFHPIGEETVQKEYELYIDSESMLLDVVHLEYGEIHDLNGNKIE